MEINTTAPHIPEALTPLIVCSGDGCGCRYSREELGAEGIGLIGNCPACSHPRAQHPGSLVRSKSSCNAAKKRLRDATAQEKEKRPRPRKVGNGIPYSGEMAAPEVPPGTELQVPPVGEHRIAPLCQLPMFAHLRDGHHEHNRARGRCRVCKKTCAFYCVQCSTVTDDPNETELYTICNMTRHPCFFNHLILQQQQQQHRQHQHQQVVQIPVVTQTQLVPQDMQNVVVGSNIIV